MLFKVNKSDRYEVLILSNIKIINLFNEHILCSYTYFPIEYVTAIDPLIYLMNTYLLSHKNYFPIEYVTQLSNFP